MKNSVLRQSNLYKHIYDLCERAGINKEWACFANLVGLDRGVEEEGEGGIGSQGFN